MVKNKGKNKGKTESLVAYHYTSLEVLYILINNAKRNDQGKWDMFFHASSLYYMNDWSEMHILPNALHKLDKVNPLIDFLVVMNGNPYAISFCNDADSLSMWLNYADNCTGVALHIDKDVLKRQFNQNSYFLGNCEYVDESKLIKGIRKNHLYKEYQENRSEITSICKLLMDTMKYKNRAFKYENEYRLGISTGNNCQYKFTRNQIVPYVEIPIPTEAFIGVTIGPCQNYEKAKYAIQGMCENKFGTYYTGALKFWERIEKSEIPYINF